MHIFFYLHVRLWSIYRIGFQHQIHISVFWVKIIRGHHVVGKTSKSAVNAGSGVAGEEVWKHQTGMLQRLYLVTENSRFHEMVVSERNCR